MKDHSAGRSSESFPVPAAGYAAITIWTHDLVLRHQMMIGRDRVVVVGRAPEILRVRGAVVHVTLEQDKLRLMSRAHVIVAFGTRGGWRVSHAPDVKHPGQVRYWGDLAWADAGLDSYLRLGLIAYLFPGEPTFILTVTAPTVPVAVQRAALLDNSGTLDRKVAVRIGSTDSQRMVLTDVLDDAVRWPPTVADGRVRGWHELGHSAAKADSPRKTYERLKTAAAKEGALAWSGGPARGVDPLLLRKLIDSGEITYAEVYRQHGEWPGGGLMPTHHTHIADGRRRSS